MAHAQPAIIMISFFGFAAFLTYMYFNTRHRERMALIESGRDAGIFNKPPTKAGSSSLKWGLVLTMIGLALGIGIFSDMTMHNEGPVITAPLVIIFAGVGLLIFYKIVKDQDNHSDEL